MNARFWIMWNGDWVKITLRPGQSISMCAGRNHEEGFSCEAEVYSFDCDVVECAITSWGRDCDGRYDVHMNYHCHVTQLKAHDMDDGTIRPQWERGHCEQYDQFAEMAGY